MLLWHDQSIPYRLRRSHVSMAHISECLSLPPPLSLAPSLARFPIRCSSVRSRVFAVPFFAYAAAASTAFCPRVVGSCTNGGGSFSGSIHYRMTKGWEEEEEEEYAEEAGPEKRVLYSFF